jgi:hypothetical protein
MSMQPKPFLSRYPVIVSSINGRRRPGKAEIRTVAVRIFHEIHGIGPNRRRSDANIRHERPLVGAAKMTNHAQRSAGMDCSTD